MADFYSELKITALVSTLDDVLSFVDGPLEERSVSMKNITTINIATEEIYVNIAQYAYKNEGGEAIISLRIEGNKATIELTDWGAPYNPLAKKDPDVSLSVQDRPIGGLGIYMVKKTMDEVTYRYENDSNILTMVKYI